VARSLPTSGQKVALGKIAARYPGLASAVRTQVTRLIDTVLPAADGAIATEAQIDPLLESVVERVVVGRGQSRSDPPTALGVAITGGASGWGCGGAGGGMVVGTGMPNRTATRATTSRRCAAVWC